MAAGVTNYPGAQDDNTTLPSRSTFANALSDPTMPHDQLDNNVMAAVKALEAKVGYTSAAPNDAPPGGGTVLLSDAAGKTKWAANSATLAGYYSVIDYGAKGDGVTDDTAAFAAAIAAASAAGGGIVTGPPAVYVVKRSILGDNTTAAISLKPGVSLQLHGVTLKLRDDCPFVGVQKPLTATVATVTGDIAFGASALVVNSTTGFTVGDEVFVRAGDNVVSAAETACWLFAKVLTITDATHMTLDRPILNAVTVASTATINKQVTKLSGLCENFTIDLTGSLLLNDIANGGFAEQGVRLVYCRDAFVRGVRAQDPGAGAVSMQFVDTAEANNIRVPTCVEQGGATSLGRVIEAASVKNVRFVNIYGEHFQGCPVFIEGYSTVTVEGLHLVNNYPGRDNTGQPLIQVAEESHVTFRDTTIEGVGCDVFENGATNAYVAFEGDTVLNTSTMIGGFALLRCVRGTLTLGSIFVAGVRGVYRRHKRYSATGTVPVNSSLLMNLPTGLITELRAIVTNKTGITGVFITSSGVNQGDFHTNLTNNVLVDLSNPFGVNLGTDYTPNTNALDHQFEVFSDGTAPGTATLTVEVEVLEPETWTSGVPALPDDTVKGKVQV